MQMSKTAEEKNSNKRREIGNVNTQTAERVGISQERTARAANHKIQELEQELEKFRKLKATEQEERMTEI